MMRTAAYFSDFTESQSEEKIWSNTVREKTGAEILLGVMSGDYLQSGLPAEETKEKRAEKALASGVDLVAEMSLFSSVSSIGIYAYSAMRILDKMDSVDCLLLETEDASIEALQKIAILLIQNDRTFQAKVTQYKNQGRPFYMAQAKAIGEYIESGEQIMLSWYNIFAVECIRSLKIMYNDMECVAVPKREKSTLGTRIGDAFSEYLRYQIYLSETQMSDIYGGSDILTNIILDKREQYKNFEQFSALVAGESRDLFDIRKYMLHLILGISKSAISVWRRYDFSPYCRIHLSPAMEKNAEAVAYIQKKTRIELVMSEQDEQMLDRSGKKMLEMERRAERIYRLQD